MDTYWYMTWADKTKSPSQKSLNKWSLVKWLEWKAVDQQQAIADINMTMSVVETNDDGLFRRIHSIEANILKYLQERFDVVIKPIPTYVPRMVDAVWMANRYKELERQRKTFSTMAYWKKDKPEKKQLNGALQLIQGGLRQYESIDISSWKGLIDAFNEYVEQLEFYQIAMATARFHSTWSDDMAKVHIRVRKELRNLHKDCLGIVEDKLKTGAIRPWLIDEDAEDILTQAELDSLPLRHWEPTADKNMPGPPRMTDGPAYDLVTTETLTDICMKRRNEIDDMIMAYRQGRFSIVKNLWRRERKVWGRALQSLAQYKRWGIEE